MKMPENKKTEVRFAIDQDFLEKMQKALGQSKTTDIARTAFTILDWAANEVKNGRQILSSDPEGSDVHRLVVPGLSSKS
jgi:hypothetical protein